MSLSSDQHTFLTLLKAGLWETDVQLHSYGEESFIEVYKLAEEQSVVGLVAAGLEHIEDYKPSRTTVLPFLTQVIILEQRNQSMNDFLIGLIDRLRKAGVYSLLVKGQGIAQCYERPLWRAAGDIDLFLDNDYEKAKTMLLPEAKNAEQEYKFLKHIGFTLGDYVVELHGTMRSRLSKRADKVIDSVQHDTFQMGNVRAWRCGETDIFLPGANNDVIFVFTHILHHFFSEGIGLRQVCDWCRLLWTYKDKVDSALLEKRLRKMGLMSEWSAFAALAVDWLGMPVDAMPLYKDSKRYKVKSRKVLRYILETGNFGTKNHDNSSSRHRPYLIRKLRAFWSHSHDSLKQFVIFPIDTIKAWWRMFYTGLNVVADGVIE